MTIDCVKNNFNNIYDKIVNLKDTIEKEIIKINNLYEKTMEDLTKGYSKKHEELLKVENELKEKLQFEVTKYKEQLENNLSIAVNDLRVSERLLKGIEKMKDKEENIIKIISYISKANKTQREMINLSKKFMKNIHFKYEYNKSQIKFEEYFFNGIPIPQNIDIKDISYNEFIISWNIELNDFGSNNFKYILEIKRENENFKKIYEGNEKQYLVYNLLSNSEYEIRICTVYNNVYGEWSLTKKIKVKAFESSVLKETYRQNEFINKLLEWTNGKSIKLIYRGSKDGMNNKAFYQKCSNKGPTIILIKNERGNIFGGYASKSWLYNEFNTDTYRAPDSFLFTLTNIYNIQPTKFPSKNNQKELKCNPKTGPIFGNGTDLGLKDDFLKKGGWTYLGDTYPDVLGKGRSIFTGDSDNTNNLFKVKEVEAFLLIK